MLCRIRIIQVIRVMEIYLIRHTTPDVPKGICYGQTDLDVVETFEEEVALTKAHLPQGIEAIYSSPLQRCKKLADALFPEKDIQLYPDLKELDCGAWEMQPWDDIPKADIQPWMDDFIQVSTPGGESYASLHERVVRRFEEICQGPLPAAIVAHGGVLRSIAAHITATPLKESFDVFTFHYGCVVKLVPHEEGFTHELLYNHSAAGKEWHRPSVNTAS